MGLFDEGGTLPLRLKSIKGTADAALEHPDDGQGCLWRFYYAGYVECESAKILRETPCGWWAWFGGEEKWIGHSSRVWGVTPRKALKKFAFRGRYYVKHCKGRLASAEDRVTETKELLDELEKKEA